MAELDGLELDEALRAISHPDRRLFLRACRDRQMAAGDLAALSALSLATVSEHLKVLRKSGLMVLTKQGRFWLYRADDASLAALSRAVARLTK